MPVIQTTCTMDCPDTCTLDVEVKNGHIEAIRGARGEHPTTNGFICDKIRHFDRRVYHETRLLYPMRRVGPKGAGEFERISWDDALATITTRFREIAASHGAEAILPYNYGGSNGFLGDGFIDALYFARLGASRIERTLCAAPTGAVAAGMYGKMPGVAPEDYVDAKMIMIWGANPKASQIHLVPYLQQARKNGAFIATIDPREALAAKEVDMHLQIMPGSDLPVALAMIDMLREMGAVDYAFLEKHAGGWKELLDAARAWPVDRAAKEARVDADKIRELVRRYAEASPAVVRCGWGLERNSNGGHAVAAVLALPAIAGKFGVRSGGYTMSNSGAAKLNTSGLFGSVVPSSRLLNMSRLGALLNEPLDPPIKAIFVYNCNPAATAPDQNAVVRGLEREDLFTVVFDQVMTDSARYADILLPAVTFLEQREVKRGYGSLVVGGVQPAIEPRGEAKPNEEVFAALGRAMGFEDAPFGWTTDDCVRYVAENLDMSGRKPDLERLRDGKVNRYDFPGTTPVQFGTVFPRTPDKRVQIRPEALGANPWSYVRIEDPAHPLAMITPSTSRMISSSMGEFNFDTLTVELHPDDATARGIEDGDTVRVFNSFGEVVCAARVASRVRRGVVAMAKGAWMKSSKNGRTGAALCPPNVEPVAGGACYNDARVEVAAVMSRR